MPPPPPKGRGGDNDKGGRGLAGVGRCTSTHRALGEPTTGPWEGRGGGHLGAQPFRRAATPGVGGGGGGLCISVTVSTYLNS